MIKNLEEIKEGTNLNIMTMDRTIPLAGDLGPHKTRNRRWTLRSIYSSVSWGWTKMWAAALSFAALTFLPQRTLPWIRRWNFLPYAVFVRVLLSQQQEQKLRQRRRIQSILICGQCDSVIKRYWWLCQVTLGAEKHFQQTVRIQT